MSRLPETLSPVQTAAMATFRADLASKGCVLSARDAAPRTLYPTRRPASRNLPFRDIATSC